MKEWIVLILAGMLASSAALADDWRRDGSDAEKLEQLIRAMPNTAAIMLQVGERYNNLYWAARQGQWEYAGYQMAEMQGALRRNAVTRPGRAADIQKFLDEGFEGMEEAIEAQDDQRFFRSFEQMRGQCMVCHADSGYAFIKLPAQPPRPNNPALYQ
ncbi:hypothetical protein [Thioalkalivibrio denitrificans]|nr:hypothetical protein [Thioalkalivibrio denitrificans]